MGNIMCAYKEREIKPGWKKKNFIACLKRIVKLVEEVPVVTFLHFHFANRKPHNIFTILLDVPLRPKLCLKNSPEDWRLPRCGLGGSLKWG